jgi:tRNA nucleotidyltransferase (CCA-adding enzyme)
MEVITTHTNADFDTIASMVAARKLYPGARLAFPGSLEKGLRDAMDTLELPCPIDKARDIDLEKITRLVLVDIRQASRIGEFAGIIGRSGIDIHVYDHHPRRSGDIRGSIDVYEKYGSTTTILTLLIKERGLALTSGEATILMTGIYEDTGSLTYPSTTGEDYEAASFLLSSGADLSTVAALIRKEMTPAEVSALNDL